MTYCTEKLYIENATSLEQRLERYEQIIEALELQMVNVGAGNSDIEEYTLDDGQVKISTTYRDVNQIAKAIQGFEFLRQKIINKLNGRSVVIRPWRGLC